MKEKRKASSKTKAKRIIFLTAIFSLISFLYKMGLGLMTMSLVLIIASISTLMIFICKILFVNNVYETRQKKKRAYFFMTLSTLVYALIFVAFVAMKVNGIDISNNKTYEGYIGAIFILFLLIMFILSCINLRGALEKTDIMVIGLKEMTFVSALSDLVIIEEFVSRIILQYRKIDILVLINSYFSLGVGIIMVVVGLRMFIRFIGYKTN